MRQLLGIVLLMSVGLSLFSCGKVKDSGIEEQLFTNPNSSDQQTQELGDFHFKSDGRTMFFLYPEDFQPAHVEKVKDYLHLDLELLKYEIYLKQISASDWEKRIEELRSKINEIERTEQIIDSNQSQLRVIEDEKSKLKIEKQILEADLEDRFLIVNEKRKNLSKTEYAIKTHLNRSGSWKLKILKGTKKYLENEIDDLEAEIAATVSTINRKSNEDLNLDTAIKNLNENLNLKQLEYDQAKEEIGAWKNEKSELEAKFSPLLQERLKRTNEKDQALQNALPAMKGLDWRFNLEITQKEGDSPKVALYGLNFHGVDRNSESAWDHKEFQAYLPEAIRTCQTDLGSFSLSEITNKPLTEIVLEFDTDRCRIGESGAGGSLHYRLELHRRDDLGQDEVVFAGKVTQTNSDGKIRFGEIFLTSPLSPLSSRD